MSTTPKGLSLTEIEFRRQLNTRRLVQVLLELSLISHVKGTSYDPSTSGGKPESTIPSGGIDRKGDRETEFRQKSAEHFARRLQGVIDGLNRLSNLRVEQLRDEILEQAMKALCDWRRTPDAEGVDPEHGTLAWKCRVANDPRSSRVVAGHYGTTHVSVIRYRRQYAGIRV